MPNPQFTKPWHGVPRESIQWNPSIIEDACIGCGTCVTGCSRLVYRFDFERKKPVVVDPLNCMVGCTTCANTCPAHAIAFPPIDSILALEGLPQVRHGVEDDLLKRHDVLAASVPVPHADRIVTLKVHVREQLGADVLRIELMPRISGECFCEFVPGQYIELWQPGSDYLSRSYSIANAPEGDGRIELHIRRVEGGRFASWAFDQMKVGDELLARGPLGGFTMRSPATTPLLFVAGGTGYAPIHALLLQQLRFQPDRDMVLLWGMRAVTQFYAVDEFRTLQAKATHLRIVLAFEQGDAPLHPNGSVAWQRGTVLDSLQQDAGIIPGRDIYAAGPPMMLRGLAQALHTLKVEPSRVHVDSFGV